MITRIGCALVLGCLFVSTASAQTVRFDTNVGTFDMVLNPTGNPDLQPYVDNLLAYVNSRRYDLSVINRAADGVAGDISDDFVLQMGGFQATTATLPNSFSTLTAVPSFAALVQDTTGDNIIDLVDAVAGGLTNSRRTVSFALPDLAPPPGGPGNVNAATREFFVNVGDNTFLDAIGASGGFIPFAEVTDLATIDLVMGLSQMPTADGDSRSSDLPILNSNRIVFIERAFVVLEPFVGPIAAATASAIATPPPAAVQALSVPEPPALVIAVGALMLLAALKRGKIQ